MVVMLVNLDGYLSTRGTLDIIQPIAIVVHKGCTYEVSTAYVLVDLHSSSR